MSALLPFRSCRRAARRRDEVRGANPPGALDLPPSNVVPAPVEMAPTAPAQRAPSGRLDPTGNPLWAIPLSSLTATRERPIFLPSRRAPAPAVAGRLSWWRPRPLRRRRRARAAAAYPGRSDRGRLEGFAVFLDQATNSVVRLKTGQDHDGWVLRSVKGREATLEKDKRTTTLALPVRPPLSRLRPRLHRRPCFRARAETG